MRRDGAGCVGRMHMACSWLLCCLHAARCHHAYSSAAALEGHLQVTSITMERRSCRRYDIAGVFRLLVCCSAYSAAPLLNWMLRGCFVQIPNSTHECGTSVRALFACGLKAQCLLLTFHYLFDCEAVIIERGQHVAHLGPASCSFVPLYHSLSPSSGRCMHACLAGFGGSC